MTSGLRSHEFDPLTQYCRHCGAPKQFVWNHIISAICRATPNVVAVSHIIARRRAAEIFGSMDPTITDRS